MECRFNTAYCTVLEREALPEIFGRTDVMADTLPELADRVVANTTSRSLPAGRTDGC